MYLKPTASILYKLVIFIFLIAGSHAANAQPYKYLRITFDDMKSGGIQVDKIRWKMGDEIFPLTELRSFVAETESKKSENSEVILNASYKNFQAPPYKAFENDGYSTYLAKATFPASFSLQFKNPPIHPTGIEVSVAHGAISNFHCEGSNDGQSWDLLYTSPTLTPGDYVTENHTFSADFGDPLPASIDQQAPSIPANLQVINTSRAGADITWDAATDSGVGVLFYEVFIDGELWQTSDTPSVTVYGLAQKSSHTVQISSVDAYGNRSALSISKNIDTPAYPVSSHKMKVGTMMGIADINSGIYKDPPDFSGDWKSTNAADGPFTQGFIDDMKKFSHIRYMGVFAANGTAIVNWEDRIQANNPRQIAKYHKDNEITNLDVLSYEWAIYLSNITNTDMWLNVPGDASEDYIRQLGTLLKNNLNPNLKVYLENGNETWSAGFHVALNYRAKAEALGIGSGYTGGLRYTVYKTIRVFKWFGESFGDESRVIKILAGQMNNPFLSTVHVKALKDPVINPEGIKPDFVGVAAYFQLGGEEGEDGYIRMQQSIDARTIGIHQQQYDIWQAEGIDLIAYEGGIQMNLPLRSTYSADKGIYNTYLYYLDEVAPFFSIYTNFQYTSTNTNANNFGAIDYVGQPLTEALKLKGLFDWIKINSGGDPLNVTTIDFEDVAVGRHPTILTQGFSFEPTRHGELFIRNDATHGLQPRWGERLKVSKSDGSSFSLKSFDFRRQWLNRSGSATIKGYKEDGSILTSTFIFNESNSEFTTMTLSWSGLTKLEFTVRGAVQLDNFVL